MQANRIARTRTRDLQPLGTAGQFASESWQVLAALLERELSPDHAALLAEPVRDPNRGETDWYTVRPGSAVALSSLPGDVQTAVQARLGVLVGDIHALGGRLLSSRSDSERFTGELVMLCIQVPDQDRVMVVDGQPVLVGWGHSRTGAAAVSATLIGRKAVTKAVVILPPPSAPVQPERSSIMLLAGVLLSTFVGLAVAAALLLFDPFGWTDVTVAQCAVPKGQTALAAALQDIVAREGALQLELARLETDAGRRRLQCAPVPSAVTPPPDTPAPPLPPAVNRDAQRAERQGAKTGKLQFILAWDDRNDLDLRVVCPVGVVIDYEHRQNCGGNLDVDANGDFNHLTDNAVENVYFPEPQPGRYRVLVDPYGMRVRASTPFRLTIRQDGQPDREVTGTAQNGRRNQVVTEIEVAPRP